MNWLDVVIALLIALSVWDGWRQGVVTQILGLAALALGVWLAWKFGGVAGEWFGNTEWAGIAGFIAVFILVVISVIVVGKFTRGLFKIVGLGIFDSVFGVLFSLVKMFALVGLVMMIFATVDPGGKVISERVRENSALLQVIETVNGVVFPFVQNMFNSL
jgi:membrane protein required for colicin V production